LLLLGAGIGLPATEGGQALYCLKWELKTSLSLAARGVVRQGAMEEGETRGEQGAFVWLIPLTNETSAC